MSHRVLLLGDVGGTHARFSVSVDGQIPPPVIWPTRGLPALGELCQRLSAGAGAPIEAACLAIAAPISGGRARLTNADWTADLDDLPVPGRLVNDLEAAAAGLDACPGASLTLLRGAPHAGGPRVVLGVGTGLGAALVIDGRVVPGEGGHALISPVNTRHQAVIAWLRSRLGRPPEWEDALSGPGLGRLVGFVATEDPELPGPALSAALRDGAPWDELAALATAHPDDPAAAEAAGLFAELLGAAARGLALTVLARGGVWICGGVAPRLRAALAGPRLGVGLDAPGPVMAAIADLAVVLVDDPLLNLRGALRLAP
jgi:glucokinase